jgi:hypothetical protein
MSAFPRRRKRPYSRLTKSDHDTALLNGWAALLVLVALCRLQSDAKPDEKHCFPAGAAAISKHCGLTARAVKKYIPKLAAQGLIAITSGRQIAGQKHYEENRYTLLSSELSSLPREPDAGVEFPVYAVKKEQRKRKAVERFVPEEVPLPHGQEFAAAWRQFCKHRREIRKALTPTAASCILRELGEVQEAEAVRATQDAVARGWRKPYPQDSGKVVPLLGRTPMRLVL